MWAEMSGYKKLMYISLKGISKVRQYLLKISCQNANCHREKEYFELDLNETYNNGHFFLLLTNLISSKSF